MNWRTRAGIAVVGLLGASVAGILTAQMKQAEAYSERPPVLGRVADLIPLYPNTRFLPMGTNIHVDGVSREMAYATTPDPPHKIADRYEGIWVSQGFRVNRESVGADESVTASDEMWVRTVVASPSAGGSTIVASVREAVVRPAKPRIPVPPICSVVSHTGSKDGEVITEMIFLSCEGYLSEVLDFFDDALYGITRNERREGVDRSSGVYVTYAADDLHVILTASQRDSDPPRVGAAVTWQERR